MNETCQHNRRATDRRLRTLIVDDSRHGRETLRNYLGNDERFEVIGSASNGRHAVELVTQLQPDVVLMDLQMPEMNGLEAARLIKSRPDAPLVVLVTSQDTVSCRAEARAAGTDGFVSKMALDEELPQSLNALHQKHHATAKPPTPGTTPICAPSVPPPR